MLLAHLANTQEHLAELPDRAFKHLAKVSGGGGACASLGAALARVVVDGCLGHGRGSVAPYTGIPATPARPGIASRLCPLRPITCARSAPLPPTLQVSGLVDQLAALSDRGCRVDRLLGMLCRAAMAQLPARPHYEQLLQALLARVQMGGCRAVGHLGARGAPGFGASLYWRLLLPRRCWCLLLPRRCWCATST